MKPKQHQKKTMAPPKTVPRPQPKRRAADLAYDAIETLLSTLQLEPGSQIVEADLADHLDVIQTRRVLELLIAACSARRATALQRKEIVRCAELMVKAAHRGDLNDYMQADRALDFVNHQASHNDSAVKAVTPLIVQCRRFWYAYQHEGEIVEGANAHLELAQGIATGDEAAAIAGANRLLDYLELFARKIIDK